MASVSARPRPREAGWARTGLIAGLLSGIVYIVYQLVVAEITGEGLLAPLRWMGSLILGEDALSATYSIGIAAIVGIVVALVLSAIYGIAYAMNAAAIPYLRDNPRLLIAMATLWGFILYIVNFFFFGRTFFGWIWTINSVWQFLGCTFFFGTVLGLLLVERRLFSPAR